MVNVKVFADKLVNGQTDRPKTTGICTRSIDAGALRKGYKVRKTEQQNVKI